jgi:hypothetical protein
MKEKDTIVLETEINFDSALNFPMQHALARREVLIGAFLLLLPGIGWILNMGHRIQMVHEMMHDRSPWPSWKNFPKLFWHGLITFIGMLEYNLPTFGFGYLGITDSPLWFVPAVLCFILAAIAIPGYMSHYCLNFEVSEIFNPFKALKRVHQGGKEYWRAWKFVLVFLFFSPIGFYYTSVWFWQSAGFSFARVFYRKVVSKQ